MYQAATGARSSGVTELEEVRARLDSSAHAAPLADSRGIVRDALAALRNLEHLLRSPRVGPRALAQVIPGLQGLCDPFLASVEQLLSHVRVTAALPVDGACEELEAFTIAVCDRLRAALMSGVATDARSRLAFESSIVRAAGALDSVRQLLDLLVRANEQSVDTELHIDEALSVLFAPATRPISRTRGITVIASYTGEGTGFDASPQVLLPLVSVGIAMVHGAVAPPDDPVFLSAACQDDALIVAISNDCPVKGESYPFDPPLIVPPTLECARTAARLVSASFEADPGRAVISWPRRS